uniref:Uncharacterized protein n=1 Tax=Amphimedon queenslandica TaxID=400682 RepID=A0A1X7UC51_AMPQE
MFTIRHGLCTNRSSTCRPCCISANLLEARNMCYIKNRAEVDFQDQSLRQAVPAVASHNQGHAKRKKKSLSQIRRNQKRLADFKRRKSREGSTGLKDNPVKLDQENTAAIADSDHVDTNGDIAASESSTSKIDLCSCDSVVFEERNGVPGVNYEVDGKAGWIPVREHRRGKSHLKQHDEGSDSETEELRLPVNATVRFLSRDGSPGLHIANHKVKYWPPIAVRTRSKLGLQ